MKLMHPHQPFGMSIDGRVFYVWQELNGTLNCWEVAGNQRLHVVSAKDRRDVVECVQDVYPGREKSVRFPQPDGTALTSVPRPHAHGIALSVTITEQPPEPAVNQRTKRESCALDRFAWFCRGETRENVRAAAADLRKDVRDMRKQGCGRWHILGVRFWITTTTIVPLVWDVCMRISKTVPVLGTIVRAVSSLLRKIDPPRFS